MAQPPASRAASAKLPSAPPGTPAATSACWIGRRRVEAVGIIAAARQRASERGRGGAESEHGIRQRQDQHQLGDDRHPRHQASGQQTGCDDAVVTVRRRTRSRRRTGRTARPRTRPTRGCRKPSSAQLRRRQHHQQATECDEACRDDEQAVRALSADETPARSGRGAAQLRRFAGRLQRRRADLDVARRSASIWISSSTGCERADVTGVKTSAAWCAGWRFPQQRNCCMARWPTQ